MILWFCNSCCNEIFPFGILTNKNFLSTISNCNPNTIKNSDLKPANLSLLFNQYTITFLLSLKMSLKILWFCNSCCNEIFPFGILTNKNFLFTISNCNPNTIKNSDLKPSANLSLLFNQYTITFLLSLKMSLKML